MMAGIEHVEHDVIPLRPPFDVVLRGFDRLQVADHIESLQGHLALVESDRDAAVRHADDLRKEIEHLRSQDAVLEHLRSEAAKLAEQRQRLYGSPIAGIGGRVEHMLTLAEQEASEIRAEAERDITELRSQAEQDVAAQREHAHAEAEQLTRDTTRRCEQLEAASQQRREQAERDSEREIQRRQTESDERIADNEQQSLARLYLAMRTAGEELASRVAQARQELAHLTGMRDEISEQLSTASWLLTQAIGNVQAARSDRPDDLPEQIPAQRQITPNNQDHHTVRPA